MDRLRAKLAIALIRTARKLLRLPDAVDPDYDTCGFCGVTGCEHGDPEHAPDCPLSTGIFPVTLRDMWPAGPAQCESCKTLLWPGATYSLIPFDGDLEGVPGGTVACTGCALLAQIPGDTDGE